MTYLLNTDEEISAYYRKHRTTRRIAREARRHDLDKAVEWVVGVDIDEHPPHTIKPHGCLFPVRQAIELYRKLYLDDRMLDHLVD